MTNKLFIGNLSRGVRHEQLVKHFSPTGTVVSAQVILDRKGLGRGYGFVEMSTKQEAAKAKEILNHTEIDGMKIDIQEEKHQP